MMPRSFWRTTLAEWRALLDGYADRMKGAMKQQAWSLSYLLVAAGCEADKVTPAKLLGEKEKAVRQRKPRAEKKMPVDEFWKLLQQEPQNQPAKVSDGTGS